MSALPYLIMAAVSIWAVIATALAIVRGRNLSRERQDHEASQDKTAKYGAALAQLKHRTAATAGQLDVLQQAYNSLLQSVESEAQPDERPIPMIMVDSLDISSEVGLLFEHVARVAVAVRSYSAYTRGHHAFESSKARYDLLWLSDCLHTFDQIGKALLRGSPASLTEACEELVSMYRMYPKDGSGYNSRDTFQRLEKNVPLTEVIDAIASIIVKAAPQSHVSAGENVPAAGIAERVTRGVH